jgi:hypothetical protein
MYNNAMKKYLMVAGFVLVLLAALMLLLFYKPGPRVLVQSNPQYKETVYSFIGRDKKEISFTTYQTETNEQVLRFRSDSTLPLKEQLQLASILLDRLTKDQPLSNFKTLSIGRLVMSFGTDKTYSRRLINAARPSSPIPFFKQNNSVRDIANRNMIYSELRDLFAKFGIAIKLSAVEKVLVNENGIPYDGMIWFSISKLK